MNKKFARSNDRMVLGVAGGIAEYLEIDPVIVRLVFALFTLSSMGYGLAVYFLLALVMPENKAAPQANNFDPEEIIIHDSE